MPAIVSNIKMMMCTALAILGWTCLLGNASTTQCPQALECMKTISQSSSCSETDTVFTCLTNLRGTCSVNESKVAFKDVVQPTKDMCNAIANHPSDVESCSTFWPCREKSTLAQVMEASPRQQKEMSGHLVSSYTFCRYAEDMAACFVSEKEAGRCTFSTAFLSYMMDIKQNLSKLCEGNLSSTTREVLPTARKMATKRGKDAYWCWILVSTLQTPCTICYEGTTAAQWTLYPGVSLSWNEASMFCKSLGGHLPVLNTKLRSNAFNSTVLKWNEDNLVSQDIWTGLFSEDSGKVPIIWEADCSVQPSNLTVWGSDEPNGLTSEFCVRYKWSSLKFATWTCQSLENVVCEFDAGSCRYSTSPGSLVTSLLSVINLETKNLGQSSKESCWQQCMNYTPTANGEECVAAVFHPASLSTKCTLYVGDTLMYSQTAALSSLVLGTTTILKECFQDEINKCYSGYSYVDKMQRPMPAGNPCSSGITSFVPVVPTSTCVQTSTAASTQTPRSGDTTTQTTNKQVSTEYKTYTTWSSRATYTWELHQSSTTQVVSTSGLQDDVSWTMQSIRTPTTEGATATTSQSSETIVENTSSIRTESQTTTDYGITLCSSLSKRTSSPKGCVPVVLCPCMKSNTNISTILPVTHRNTTSRYRRSHNSEWGSPSVYTSTSSATVITFAGIACLLFVVCDTTKLMTLFEKKR